MRSDYSKPKRARGVTLFEVLIVVAILAMVTGAVAIVAIRHFDRAKERMALANGRTVRTAVTGYWMESASAECPTVEDLVRDETLDRDNAKEDPWGSAWRIECDGRRVVVHSNGRDRVAGTADDIRIPPV